MLTDNIQGGILQISSRINAILERGVIMINVAKLKGLIVERGTTQQAVADSIGIDRSTFYRKMKKGGDFSIEEAKGIKEQVPLSDAEAIEIFFGKEVAFTLQKKGLGVGTDDHV